MKSFRLCVLLTLTLCGGIAHADIYRYVNADGVATFTNVRPQVKYEVIMRDPKPVEQPAAVARSSSYPVRGYAMETRSRYASHIQAASKAANVDPALVHAVISAESGYNPSARSRAGAVGLMQLMPGTAKRYGVRNRLDPAQNIHGGAQYLRDLQVQFDNDLQLVLAAYNAGEGAVMRFGGRIPPYRETVAYVPKVLSTYKKFRPATPSVPG